MGVRSERSAYSCKMIVSPARTMTSRGAYSTGLVIGRLHQIYYSSSRDWAVEDSVIIIGMAVEL
jgi:hypothetical protein